jgi:hypothetical protein
VTELALETGTIKKERDSVMKEMAELQNISTAQVEKIRQLEADVRNR